MKKFVKAVALALFALAAPAFAQDQIRGTVYQIEPGAVYVEMTDHTAVRVPISLANFMVNGVSTDVANLRIGTPLVVQYLPDTTAVPVSNSLYSFPPPTEGVYYRDLIEKGKLVHYVWYSGRWHRQ